MPFLVNKMTQQFFPFVLITARPVFEAVSCYSLFTLDLIQPLFINYLPKCRENSIPYTSVDVDAWSLSLYDLHYVTQGKYKLNKVKHDRLQKITIAKERDAGWLSKEEFDLS